MIKYQVDQTEACWLWHKWQAIHSNGFSIYYVCINCQSRKVTLPFTIYQPLDWDWLDGTNQHLGEDK